MPKPMAAAPKIIVHVVTAVFEEDAAATLAALKPAQAGFLEARGFTAKAGSLIVLPGEGGALAAWFGLGPRARYTPMVFRALPGQLPKGQWRIVADKDLDRHAVHVAWGLGAYRFDRYKSAARDNEVTLDDDGLSDDERNAIALEVQAHTLARDLVNTPANDMGPAEIEHAARAVADAHGATFAVIRGDDLLRHNYPAVHAVGRAAAPGREPRFIELNWEPLGHVGPAPVVVLIGKGVAFDTGGLDIKPSSGMGLMKKDMGGAAHALALADWVMASNLPVSLHVLVPAVENSISGAAMRPSDVIPSRAGLTIEIGNTDAEGRLILADALARANELSPDLTLDFATLTGAARVALGPEVVPFYCDDEDVARRIEVASLETHDPLWRMPLWPAYRDALDSDIADVRNDPASWAQGGSVLAALFLQKFAPKTGSWAHFDIYAWNPRSRSGFQVGAEAQGLRALFNLLKSY